MKQQTNKQTNTNYIQGRDTVFGRDLTRGPLCLYPMIKNLILPEVGLAQDKMKNNAIQGDDCVLETPYRETTVFGSHEQKYEAT